MCPWSSTPDVLRAALPDQAYESLRSVRTACVGPAPLQTAKECFAGGIHVCAAAQALLLWVQSYFEQKDNRGTLLKSEENVQVHTQQGRLHVFTVNKDDSTQSFDGLEQGSPCNTSADACGLRERTQSMRMLPQSVASFSGSR